MRRFWLEWCAQLDAADATPAERDAALVLLARLADLTAPATDERAAHARRYPAMLAALRTEPGAEDVDDAAADLLAIAVTALPPPIRLDIAAELRTLPERPERQLAHPRSDART